MKKNQIGDYIIFGGAILFLGLAFIALSDYPGFWESTGIIIGGFAGIFVGLVIFFLYKRKQEIKNIEKQRNIEQNIIINTNKKNEEIAGLVNEIIKQNKKDFYGALEECDKCIEIIKDHKEYEDRYNQLVGIKSHIQEEIKLKEDIQKKIQNTSKNSKEEFIELINELYAIEEYGKAIEICQIAILKNPQEAIFYGLLGDMFLKNNKKENALDAYRHYLILSPNSKDGTLNIIQILKSLGRFEEALEEADKAITVDKTNKNAYLLQGEILSILGREEEALNIYYTALKNIKYEGFYLNIGFILQKQEKYQEAIEQYNEALKISPMNEDIYTNKTGCLLALKKYQEAEECANYVLDKINPNCLSVLVNKGLILGILERYEEALEILDKTIKIDPKHANSYYIKAGIYLEKDNIPETIENIRKTIELDPSFKEKFKKAENFQKIADLDEFKKLI